MKVITGVESNCMAASQGAHHVLHLIKPMPPPSERTTSQPYGAMGSELWSSASQPYLLLYIHHFINNWILNVLQIKCHESIHCFYTTTGSLLHMQYLYLMVIPNANCT